MDLQLHITLYEVDGQPRFKVHAFTPLTNENVDVTEQYTVVAAEDPETGRQGFTVLKALEEPAHGE